MSAEVVVETRNAVKLLRENIPPYLAGIKIGFGRSGRQVFCVIPAQSLNGSTPVISVEPMAFWGKTEADAAKRAVIAINANFF